MASPPTSSSDATPDREWVPPSAPLAPARRHRLVLSESPTLRSLVFFALYVVEGVPSGFALTAVFNYLIAQGLDAKATGLFAMRLGIPWSIQFLWGPLIDRFQGSPMGRRKPWVLGAQFAAFLASLGVVAVSDPTTELTALSVAFFIHGLFASVQDASVDAMAISIIPEAERGRINACMRAGIQVGTGVGAWAWANLIHSSGFTVAALAQSAVLLAMTLITAFIRERPGDSLVPWGRRDESAEPTPVPAALAHAGDVIEPSIGHVFRELARGFFGGRSLILFGLVVLVYVELSVFFPAFARYLIERLHWTDQATSAYEGIGGTVMGLGTALLGFVAADRFGPKRLLVAMMLLIGGYLVGISLLFHFWGAPGFAAAALVIWFVFDPGFSVACMPVLMGICRKGVEGSQFTAYMSLVNLANTRAQILSARLQAHFTVATIGLATGLVTLAAIPLAVLVLREPKPKPKPMPEPVGVAATTA